MIRPTNGSDGPGNPQTEGAWIYSLRTPHGKRTYIGATDRVCHRYQKEGSPGERWLEHTRNGWWRSQGYKTGKSDIPMYKMAARWHHGFGELIMTPLVTIRRKCTTEQTETEGGAKCDTRRRDRGGGTTRSRLLALEAAVQRMWKPGYVAAWSGKRCRTSSLMYMNWEHTMTNPQGI